MFYEFNEPTDGEQNTVEVVSTSNVTANVSRIVIMESDDTTRRMYFEPVLVTNPKQPGNSVSGKLVYEHKGKNDSVFPLDRENEFVSRQTIKKGDALKLNLDTGETRALYEGLRKAYLLYDTVGIPTGAVSYVEVDNAAKALLSMLERDPSILRMMQDDSVFELVRGLISLIARGASREKLRDLFLEMEKGSLDELSAGVNLAKLEKAHEDMVENLQNASEEEWQKLFETHQWIISQLFASPYTCFGSKCYVGGRSICEGGSNLCDFIYQNRMTNNTALIEIKTPETPLLGGLYRGNGVVNGVYSLSADLSGAVNQVLNYRDHLVKDYHQLHGSGKRDFEVFNPKCIVIAGMISTLSQTGMMSTFENFRNTLSGVTIVTYDELLRRVEDMINVMKSEDVRPVMTDPTAAYLSSMITDDIPF